MLALTLALALLMSLALPPVLARPETAPSPPASITLDGQTLFRLWPSKDFSAAQRVDGPNRILQEMVRSSQPVVVDVIEKNQLPVITINGRALLTVTERDTPEGLDKDEQAEIWRSRVSAAIAQGRMERQPAHVRRMVALALAFLAAALAMPMLISRIWPPLFRVISNLPTSESSAGQGARGSRLLMVAVLRGLQGVIWLLALQGVIGLFPFTRIWSRQVLDAVGDSLISPVIPLGERSYSMLDAIVLIGLFIGLIKAVGSLQTLLRSRLLRFSGFSEGAQEAVAFVVQFSLLFFGSLVILQLWGLDLSTLTLFASVLGVGVGLGLQGITKNVISGLIIIFERPIQIGDFVEVGDLQGTVKRVSLRSTEVVTLDQIAIIVPNSEFLESRVINWSHGSATSRLQIPVGVSYGSDCMQVRGALMDACANYRSILKEPAPRVYFSGFGDSALNFTLLVWINQPRKQYEITSDLNFRIEAVLRNRGITIPFPQRDLHVRGGQLDINLPQSVNTALLELARSKVETPEPP